MKNLSETDLNGWYASSNLTADDVFVTTGKSWADLTVKQKQAIYRQHSGSPKR